MAKYIGGMGVLRDALLNDPDTAELLNGGAAIATQNATATMVGDDSTDNLSAWDSIVSAHRYIIIPPGTYLFSEPMDIPARTTVRGTLNFRFGSSAGRTAIKGTSLQPAVIRAVGPDAAGSVTHARIENLTIMGASDAAFYAEWFNNSIMRDINVAGTFTDGFRWDNDCFDLLMENLGVTDSVITGANFYTGTAFNANTCNHFWTSNGGDYNFSLGGVQACTFNGLVAQGGQVAGLFLRNCDGVTFNSMYQENIQTNILGTSGGGQVINATFNSCNFQAGRSGEPFRPVACIDINNAYGVTLNSCRWEGAFGNYTPVVATATGGGSGANLLVRVHPDGTVHSIHVVRGGTGYTGTGVTISGGTGSGATATATLSAGVITAVTVNTPGSGYAGETPATIRYRDCKRILVNAPFLNTGPASLASVFYPTIMRHPSAQSQSRVTVIGANTNRQHSEAEGDLIPGAGYGYQHYIRETSNGGTTSLFSYIPPSIADPV